MKKPLLAILAAFSIGTANSQQLTAVSINLFGYLPENNNERSLRDGVVVLFNGQSDSVDLSDAKKLTNPLENIAILRSKTLLAAEQRTSFDTIPLTMWNLRNHDYELEIFLRNISVAFLEDVKTHTKKNIAAADTLRYRFTSTIDGTPQDSTISFWLIVGKSAPAQGCGHHPHRHGQRNEHGKIKLFPNPATGGYINLAIDNLSAGNCKVTVLGGTSSFTYNFIHGNNCNERINTSQLPKGKYYFIIEEEAGWKETKQIEVN